MKKKAKLPPRQLTVNRKTWNNGFNDNAGQLYDSDVGTYCILGQYLHKTLKISNDFLDGVSSPAEVYDTLIQEGEKIPQGMCSLVQKPDPEGDVNDSPIATTAIVINDANIKKQSETLGEREQKLTKLFKEKLNVTLKFTGKARSDRPE